MFPTLSRIGPGSIAAAMIIATALAHAADWDAAAELYGRGVHAYFAGRPSQAEQSLSRALTINPRDPRALYFRALSRLRLGRIEEAHQDMKAGAAIEASHSNRFAVGAALQRVQGSDRLVLEQFRRQARTKAANDRHLAHQLAPATGNRESAVLRERVVVPLDELLRPGGPQALTADELAQSAALPALLPRTRQTPTTAHGLLELNQERDTVASPPAAETPPSSPAPVAEPTETPAEPDEDPFRGFN